MADALTVQQHFNIVHHVIQQFVSHANQVIHLLLED
jgi:hypothetical protein